MRHTEMMAHMNMEKMQTVSAIKRHQVKTVHFIQVVFSLSVTLYETLVVLYHSVRQTSCCIIRLLCCKVTHYPRIAML